MLKQPVTFTLTTLIQLAKAEGLTTSQLSEPVAWWSVSGSFFEPLPVDYLQASPVFLKEALELVDGESSESLELAQLLLTRWQLLPLENYLTQLSPKRQVYLRQALYFYIQKSLQAQQARFPRPQDAPQPLWDLTCQAVPSFNFDCAWKAYTQKKALTNEQNPAQGWPLMNGSLSSWKLKAKILHGYQKKTPFSFSNLPLHLHGLMDLDDLAIAQTIEKLQPFVDLKITKCTLAGPLTIEAINHSMPTFHSLTLDYCSKIPLKGLALGQAKKLRFLSLKKSKLNEELNQLAFLPHLHTLDLTESDLLSEQILNMPPCSQIKRLSLDNCKDLNSLGIEMLATAMPGIRDLNISRCPGMHPKAALELPPLQHLKASWCDGIDDGLIDYLIERHPLRSLTLAHSRYLSDLGAESIGELPFLIHLNLNYCLGLTYDGLESCLNRLPLLESLHLSGLPLYEQGQWFNHLKHLKALSIPLHTTAEALLKLPFEQLTYLNMGNCGSWSSEEFTRLFTSRVCSKLETLIVEEARGVNDRVLLALSQIPTLKYLSLAGTPNKPQLFNDRFKNLGEMPNLEKLELSYGGKCNVDSLAQVLINARQLKTVELGPMYKLSSQDIETLRRAAPWIYITCFGYEGLKPF